MKRNAAGDLPPPTDSTPLHQITLNKVLFISSNEPFLEGSLTISISKEVFRTWLSPADPVPKKPRASRKPLNRSSRNVFVRKWESRITPVRAVRVARVKITRRCRVDRKWGKQRRTVQESPVVGDAMLRGKPVPEKGQDVDHKKGGDPEPRVSNCRFRLRRRKDEKSEQK